MHEIENFYGVYLLYCLNPKYRGSTYVGFTVNPNRRIRQHNQGKQAGGARKTHGKGPWEMVLIIHGFPNMISALRFEWAWTKPKMSRRLRHLPTKKRSEKKFDHGITVLCHMLSTGPWNRLPLTIRWLKQEYQRDLGMILDPPRHMAIEYGPVRTLKVKGQTNSEAPNSLENSFCILCCSTIKNALEENISCFGCKAVFHAICLASKFLQSTTDSNQLLPIEGICPCCSLCVLWGDLVRYKRGCYQSEIEDSQFQDFSEEAFTKWSKEIES